MIDVYEKIGRNIKLYRKRKKFTQTDLAEMMNLKRASIANYENGKQKIPVHVLIDISKVLSCSLQLMLNEERRYL